MNKLFYYISKSNCELKLYEKQIRVAIAKAEKFAINLLKIDSNIDIFFSSIDDFIIPEDGVGGRTIQSNFIIISIDLKKKISEDYIYEVICHELGHAARWAKNPEYADTLFKELISEGIATAIEEEAVHNNFNKQLFLNTVLNRSDEENVKIFNILKPKLNSNSYDYNEIFFYGNNDLPRWAGYSLGVFLVKRYMNENNLNINHIFHEKYSVFMQKKV